MSLRKDEKLSRAELFKSLSHPIRQDIILILAEQQKVGFTALQNELNRNYGGEKAVQVGTIYHHVKLLGNLIKHDEQSKSWILSEEGWFAYNLLTSSPERDRFLERGDLGKPSIISTLWRILAPPELFFFAKKSFLLFFGWQMIFILGFAILTANAHLVLFFVFFISDLNPNQDILISLISIILSWLLFTVLTLILSRQLLKCKISLEDALAMAIFLGISILPLGLFPILILSSIFDVSQPFIPLGLAIILQLWVILLAARGVSVQFFARGERAGIVALSAIYIMVALGLILGFN